MKNGALRLDQYLVQHCGIESGEKARSIIMSGIVFVNNQKVEKAGASVPLDANVELRGNLLKYVSRGGLKLEKAIDIFGLNLVNKTVMDIGASTGGFTDCMLQNGAKKVYCIDVGYGQLAWTLRNNPKVVNLERTNIRFIDKSTIEPIDFASIDVSFISLRLVLPVVMDLLNDSGECVCLVKPQFEAGRENVGKKGIVRDSNVHIDVLKKMVEFAQNSGWGVKNCTFSPVKGAQGNIEYLLYLSKNLQKKYEYDTIYIEKIVENSHQLH